MAKRSGRRAVGAGVATVALLAGCRRRMRTRTARPGAALLALAILSPEGQAMLVRHGVKAVGLPAKP